MQSKVNTLWFRAIIVLAIMLAITFSIGGIWPYLMVGIIGMIAGYAFGFVSGEEFGRDYAFKFLFGDDTREVYREYFEERLQETVAKRGDNIDVDELIAKFRATGLGLPIKSKAGSVKQETAAELEQMRKNGLN